MLSQVINQHRSAFIPGPLITDNVLIGFDCMHWLRCNRKNKTEFAALKLDMSKAYDRVEWTYLEAVLLKMGFAPSWIALV